MANAFWNGVVSVPVENAPAGLAVPARVTAPSLCRRVHTPGSGRLGLVAPSRITVGAEPAPCSEVQDASMRQVRLRCVRQPEAGHVGGVDAEARLTQRDSHASKQRRAGGAFGATVQQDD